MHAASGNWRLGFAYSLTAAFLWGFLPIALKIVLDGMDAWTITWWRFVVSMAGLGAFLAWRGELPRSGYDRAGVALLVLALVTLVSNYVLYLVSLHYTTPSVAQVVIQVAPILLLLGGVFVFGERFGTRQWSGLAVLSAGYLLFFNRRLPELAEPSQGLGLGVALIVASAVAWAIYGLAQKRLLSQFTSRQVLWLLYAGAAVLLLPFASPAQLFRLDGLELALLGFCCANTLIAYGSFGEALHHWDVSRVSAVLATAPLFTMATMAVLDRIGWQAAAAEDLNALTVGGALAVVAGSMTCALAARG